MNDRTKSAVALCACALLLALAGCNSSRVPANITESVPGTVSDALAALQPQPPVLPFVPIDRPLPVLSGSVAPRLRTQAFPADTSEVELRLLVISALDNTPEEERTKFYSEPALATWKAFLDQIGIPYEVLIASETPLTEQYLVGPDGVGRFQGVLLTTDSLVYQDPITKTFVSALSDAEWNLLWAYELAYDVRQVALYTFPGTYPEGHGLSYVEALPTGANPYAVFTTSEGQALFDYLVPQVEIPLRYTYLYTAELAPDARTPNPSPLLRDASGKVLAVLAPTSDGRERMALTFAHNPYLLHSQLLSYGMIRWVTKGRFLGERRHYFGADVDDWFTPQDEWDVDTNSVLPDAFLLSARDAWSMGQQQTALRSRYPVASDLTWTMAFNGEGSDPSARRSCNPNITGANALSRITKCLNTTFDWINHTWSHAYMDRNPPYYDIGYSAIYAEIADNDAIVDAFGFGARYASGSLVTGDVSGLGWYAPLGPDTGDKVDNGLVYSNPDLVAAAADLGRRYIAGNMSTPSHEPSCSGCGVVHPLDSRLLVVPRWPTNVFAAVTTPEQAIDAYNLVYGPEGTRPYFDRDLSYDEFLDFEADIALAHILGGAPYQHYLHVANLREYAPGASLLTDWADRVLSKYATYLTLPLNTLPWDDSAERAALRTSYAGAGATGVWNRHTETARITSNTGGTVFATGFDLGWAGQTERYGDDLISWRTFAPGEVLTVERPVETVTFTVTVSKRGSGVVTSTPSGITCGVTCTAAFVQNSTVELTATPSANSTFQGWGGACTGTGSCVLDMARDHAVSARFVRR